MRDDHFVFVQAVESLVKIANEMKVSMGVLVTLNIMKIRIRVLG